MIPRQPSELLTIGTDARAGVKVVAGDQHVAAAATCKIDRYQVSTIAAAFRSGFREFQRMGKAPAGREDGTLQVVERSLLRSSNAEIASL